MGDAFAVLGIRSFRNAARFVNALPYGRNADRADFRLVFTERHGTCSTKHALLAALAAEQELPVRLALGIYLMNGRNTPAVAETLATARLDAIPEAHCYLKTAASRVDLTWPNRVAEPPPMVWEETVRPHQIGAHKVRCHRMFITAWATKRGLDPERTWAVREACIAALG